MITGGRWHAWLLTVGMLIIGLAVTTGAVVGLDQSSERDRESRFEAAAERARGAVGARLALHTENLAHLRNWMLVNSGATREEFQQFVTLGFEQGLYPRVQALSYAPLVKRDDLEQFEATVQAEIATSGQYPPFVVNPGSGGPVSYVVTYIEPLAGNEAALGFDLASDPSRLQAIEAARDRGDAVGSGPVRLMQETGEQVGFVLWSPVYDTGDVPETAPARRRHFVGVVSVVFRLGDMFAGVLGMNPEVDAEMYDLGPTNDPPKARYDASTRLLNTKQDLAVARNGDVSGLHRKLDLNIGDRRWRMVLTPAPGFDVGSGVPTVTVALLGSLVSLLLAGVAHSTTQARGRAERRATEMTADLRAAEERSRFAYENEREITEQLRRADEVMTTFLNTISHELRTPLTAISGFADLLLTPLPPEQRDDYLRRVRRNAQSLSTLIDEVLAFARMERQDVQLHPTRLDLATEVQLVVHQLAPVLDTHRVVIDAPEAVFAAVDREALTRILTNLLNNAARYSPSGTTITVSIRRHHDRALVSVTDEGPGIPLAERSRVFDRFFRGATALASRVPGTGIGLAVVSDLARRSGGSVSVTSGEGGGARFEVELPTEGPADDLGGTQGPGIFSDDDEARVDRG